MGHERTLIHVPSKCLSLHTKGYYSYFYDIVLYNNIEGVFYDPKDR